MRKTITDIASQKDRVPLVCLTAYTAPVARMLDDHCDLLLVGDSVAMALYGFDSTLSADIEMMIRHGQAVVRASAKALIVVDMPFGSYQESREAAFRNAARLMKDTGCQAVKLEGGVEMAETVTYLSARGIPVMGHVGLRPQSVNTLGGYRSRGHADGEAEALMNDAQAIAKAGAFSIVIEGVSEPLAAAMTAAVAVPTIGIGASAACDGQILVTEDMLGISGGPMPKFVKPYADLSALMRRGVQRYAQEVRTRAFPSEEYVYPAKKKTA